jgi:hypothetical protein
MASSRDFKEDLVHWKTLVENLAPHLAALPHLAADHRALSALVAEAFTLERQQEVQRANLRQVDRQRRAIVLRARSLQNRLATGIQNAFGL